MSETESQEFVRITGNDKLNHSTPNCLHLFGLCSNERATYERLISRTPIAGGKVRGLTQEALAVEIGLSGRSRNSVKEYVVTLAKLGLVTVQTWNGRDKKTHNSYVAFFPHPLVDDKEMLIAWAFMPYQSDQRKIQAAIELLNDALSARDLKAVAASGWTLQ